MAWEIPEYTALGGGAIKTFPVKKKGAPDRQDTPVKWNQPNPEWNSKFEFCFSQVRACTV